MLWRLLRRASLLFPPLRRIRQQLHYCDREMRRLNAELTTAREALAQARAELERRDANPPDRGAVQELQQALAETREERDTLRAQLLAAHRLNTRLLREQESSPAVAA